VVGAYLGLGVVAVLAELAGGKAGAEAGIGLALIVSIIYTVLGAYAGKS
jgi:hypothetical protein